MYIERERGRLFCVVRLEGSGKTFWPLENRKIEVSYKVRHVLEYESRVHDFRLKGFYFYLLCSFGSLHIISPNLIRQARVVEVKRLAKVDPAADPGLAGPPARFVRSHYYYYFPHFLSPGNCIVKA